VYTQLLNDRGGIECDLTATRLETERYLMITGTAFGPHDLAWIRGQAEPGDDVEVRDVTSSLACLALWGPRARDILSTASPADLSTQAFPYMSQQDIVVGDVPCLALRVTYVGELGWELYPPMEFAIRLWDVVVEAGRPFGLVPAGYRAIDSLRLEKGYRVWGADITPEETPLEAGLGFAVKMDKGEFTGRQALRQAVAEGPRRRLSCLVLADPRSVALGNEPVFADGEVVGRVTSGGVGYAVGKSIAFAYLPAGLAAAGTSLAVEVFGERVDAELALDPLYDPMGERIRS
jgi:4-methylaminobutanoate oxidase (formaldehyde-forming)